MRRKRFDAMVSLVGLGLSVFLFVAAGLLNWGYSFADNTVKSSCLLKIFIFQKRAHQGLTQKPFQICSSMVVCR